MGRLTNPLKWHGGKFYLAKQIIALMPPHTHYVEPFFGGGSVLLAHSGEGRSELVNDVNGRLVNFWRVLRDPATFQDLKRCLEATPFARAEFDEALESIDLGTPVEQASRFFTVCRLSMAGRMKCFTPPTRTRTRRGMNGNVSEWIGSIEGLSEVHARFRRVFIENLDAIEVLIPREDGPKTLFYLDPPYLPDTRRSPNLYEFEMTVEQHQRLLERVKECKGKVMLSGYASELYDATLKDWSRHTFDLPNHAAGGSTKRRMTEVLYCNF